MVGISALILLLSLLLFVASVALFFFRRSRESSNYKYFQLIENSEDGFRLVENGLIAYVNPRFCEMTGYTKEELIGQPYEIILDEKGRETVREQLKLRAKYERSSYEIALRRKDGSSLPVIVSGQPVFDRKNRWIGNCGVFIDISDRKEMERELRESEARFKDFAYSVSDRYWEQDENLRFTVMHDADRKQMYVLPDGHPVKDSPIGKTRWEIVKGADVENDPRWRAHHQDLLQQKPFRDFQVKREYDEGRTVYWSVSGRPIYDKHGQFKGYRGVARDDTARVLAEEEALKAKQTLANAIQSISEGFALYDSEDRLILCNEQFRLMFPDISDSLVAGMTFEESVDYAIDTEHYVLGDLTPEQFKRQRMASRHRANGTPLVVQISGERWMRIREHRTLDGGIVGIWTDITDLKKQEQKLIQSQKMEAIGQLTGGIAHDFNNLLAVILGNLELADERLDPDSKMVRYMNRAKTGARRATALTQRLLAFSRKQPLVAKSTSVESILLGMMELLRGSLGEHIEIQHSFEEDLWDVHVDPNQLETVLLNMAVNARDAMPEGGFLSIRCQKIAAESLSVLSIGELEDGDYVEISLQDTGTGMDSEVLDRIFEPFFTTKGVGRGSGLGMSMVYGFAKQSGGHVEVDSTPGEGTRVSLYLPRSRKSPLVLTQSSESNEALRGNGERVLVVEDDSDVRQLTVNMLESLGYTVEEAEDAEMALGILNASPRFDLLLLDVVLPRGVSGPQLAQQIPNPQTQKILFMSGYTNLGGVDRVSLGEQAMLLNKPFRRKELAQKVREVLETLPVHEVKRANV
jgi:PAS domain S-box-containing protein